MGGEYFFLLYPLWYKYLVVWDIFYNFAVQKKNTIKGYGGKERDFTRVTGEECGEV